MLNVLQQLFVNQTRRNSSYWQTIDSPVPVSITTSVINAGGIHVTADVLFMQNTDYNFP